MIERLKVLCELATSRSYIIAMDKSAYISIPIVDIDNLDNVLLVHGQSKALKAMQEKLNELIKLHDERIKELSQEA